MRIPGIAWRVFLTTSAIVCLVVLAALGVSTYTGRRAARDVERRSLEQGADLTAQLLAGRGRTLAGGARVFVQGPYFRALVAERRRDDILDQSFEAAEQLGANWVFITDEHGTLLAKSDEPGAQGVALGGIPLVAGALEGRTVTGYGVSRDTLLFQAVAVPIVVPGAAPIGVLVATKVFDQQMASDVHASTAADIVFYALDSKGAPRLAATSLPKRESATALLAEAMTQTLPESAAVPRAAREVHVGDIRFALQGAALTTAGGEIVGGFLVARSEDRLAASAASMRPALAIAAALGIALALLVSWLAERRLIRPVRVLADAVGTAMAGDLAGGGRETARATRDAAADVERLGATLGVFLAELQEKQVLVGVVEAARGASEVNDPATPDDAEDDAAARSRTTIPRLSGPSARSRPGAPSAARPLPGRWTPRPSEAFATGAVFADRYVLQELIGSGLTGVVYSAVDRTTGEPVAVKMLRPELLGDDAASVEELDRALRARSRLSHRNVVRLLVAGSTEGGSVPYLAMELVHGTSLASVLAQHGALPRHMVIAIARQIMRALDAAHAVGVVHGDLKPDNVLIAADGVVKVADFGLAALVRKRRAGPRQGQTVVTPPRLAGAIVGTPEYMAPELLLGSEPDVTSDIYAAGVLLHECLTGETPFSRDTLRGVPTRNLDARPEPTDAPRSLETLVAWMTAPEPAERPRSAAEVSEAIL